MLPTVSLLPHCGPLALRHPVALGCVRPALAPPSLAPSWSGTTLCSLFLPPSRSHWFCPAFSLLLLLLPSFSASRSWPPPMLCATPLASAVLPTGVRSYAPGARFPPCPLGVCTHADASVPWPYPAALRYSGFRSAAALFGAPSAAHPQPRAWARAPASVLLRCSAGAHAASHARSGGARGVLPREATVASGYHLACCPSVAIAPRSTVRRVVLARGWAPPLVSALPCHALLHRHQHLMALRVRCPCHSAPANGGTHH